MEGEELPARVRALDFDSKCDGKPVNTEETVKFTCYQDHSGCWVENRL